MPAIRIAWRPASGHRERLLSVASIAAILLSWELATRLGWLNAFFFPPPSRLVATLWELVMQGFPEGIRVQVHAVATLRRVLIGFGAAALAAMPLGLLIGHSPRLQRFVAGPLAFARSVAPISVLPLFIGWFGISEASKDLLIAFGAFWPILTSVIASVNLVDPILVRAARSFDTPRRTIFWAIMLPAALPGIFTGLKVGLGISFMVIVAAEMIATITGLGSLIQEARTSFRTDVTMVGMLLIGAMGYAAAKGLDLLERWLLPWHARSRK